MNIREMFFSENEKPLDRLPADGGFCGILRTIACVGDSLASGEFEVDPAEYDGVYFDRYEHSWGQYLARMTGSKVYNFSAGGMTAQEYCEGWAEQKGFWNPDLAANAYIIALGCNDLFNNHQASGSMADVDPENWRNNRPTFAGYYARIIQRYKEIQPEAKFFLVTSPVYDIWPDSAEQRRNLSNVLYGLAELFSDTYIIDLEKYAPPYDEEFRRHFCLGTHMNPCGYKLSAIFIGAYIDYIIRHNMKDFELVGMMGLRKDAAGR